MGLDVSFYAEATLVHGDKHPRALTEPQEGPGEECWDTYTVIHVNPDFPDQADGLTPQSCWETGRRGAHIHHSYGGYNIFREWLCKAAHGVKPEVIWSDPDAWWDKPFVPLIHFSDCEGVIGPKTAQRLAQEFAEERERMLNRAGLDEAYDAWRDEMTPRYDEWAAAFALVGDTGFVRFA